MKEERVMEEGRCGRGNEMKGGKEDEGGRSEGGREVWERE